MCKGFVHVVDLSRAHIIALNKIDSPQILEDAYNLGSGKGYSILEILKATEKNINKEIRYRVESARNGNLSIAFADTTFANRDLDWKNLKSLDEMIIDGRHACIRNN